MPGDSIKYGITALSNKPRAYLRAGCLLPLILAILIICDPVYALTPSPSSDFTTPASPASMPTFDLTSKSAPILIARRRRRKRRRRRRRRRRKPRYAYPYSFFLLSAPPFDRKPLPTAKADEIKRAFHRGQAGSYPPNMLVKAGIAKYYPMKGGMYYRREPIKYLIMHSTETARPAGATRVIKSWSNRGRRHPGAQYVVDRDGTIYMAVDPRLSTVHVNIFKTLKGINNDNSIGIEMVHSGKQKYTEAQMDSVVKLVTYIREHFNIDSKKIITHKYAQQGHHTDPVNFAWQTFLARTHKLRNTALLAEVKDLVALSNLWQNKVVPGLEKKSDVETKITGEIKTKSNTKSNSKPAKEKKPAPETGVDKIEKIDNQKVIDLKASKPFDLTEGIEKKNQIKSIIKKSRSPKPKKPDVEKSNSSISNKSAKKQKHPKLRGPIEVGTEHVNKLKTINSEQQKSKN